MSYYAIWPFFGGLLLLLGLASTPLFAAADTPPKYRLSRLTTLDGLRGFLAIAVVFHHGTIYHRYLTDGIWALPPSRFYTLLGQVPVSLFFMVTGHLFWSRVVSSRGRLNWLRFFIDRTFRIAPLYLAAIAIMLVIVFASMGLPLRVRVTDLIGQVTPWLSLGFVIGPNIDTYPNTALLLAFVTWTLRYEWLFYFSLPVLALASFSRWTHLPFVVIALATCLHALATNTGLPVPLVNPTFAALFLCGMVSASLHAIMPLHRLPDRISSLLVLGLLAVLSCLYDTAYRFEAIMLLGAAFTLIASGSTIFGLLVSRPAKRLGDISYGIYLLQGLALYAVLRPPRLRAFAIGAPAHHWLLLIIGGILLSLAAMVAHVTIERPGVALGKRLADLLRVDSIGRPARLKSRES